MTTYNFTEYERKLFWKVDMVVALLCIVAGTNIGYAVASARAGWLIPAIVWLLFVLLAFAAKSFILDAIKESE